MGCENYDIIVAGAGIAGMRSASELEKQGFKVALVDHNIEKPQEKSLFLDESKFPKEIFNGIPINHIPEHRLINADRPKDNWGKKGDFPTSAIEHRPIHKKLLQGLDSGIDIIKSPILSSFGNNKRVQVNIRTNQNQIKTITANFLIDASGDASPISRQHQTDKFKSLIDDNPLVVWMFGIRTEGSFDPNVVYDPIGIDIGGTSWVTPLSAETGDIIAAGIDPLSKSRPSYHKHLFDNLVKFCEINGICKITKKITSLAGIIRSEPIKYSDVAKTKNVYQIGQAAGMADPLMVEALSPAYLIPIKLAESIAKGEKPTDFYYKWRHSEKMFDYTLMTALLKRRYKNLKKGIVGSNTPIYKILTENLSEKASAEALRTRKIPIDQAVILLSKTLFNFELQKNLIELSSIYLKELINMDVKTVINYQVSL